MFLEKDIGAVLNGYLSETRESTLRKGIVAFGRKLASQFWFIPFVERYVSACLEPMGKAPTSEERIRLLVLNRERYVPDLTELGSHPDVGLLVLPTNVQNLVNAIFLSSVRDITNADPDVYLRGDNSEVQKARQALNRYLQALIPRLARNNGIDAVVTCAFYYGQDREWEDVCSQVSIPFFCLHKENMKDEAIQKSTVARYRARHYRFNGTRLFVYNYQEAAMVEQAGVCDPKRIDIVGALRFDALYRDVRRGAYVHPNRQVVLFSFHHCIGLLPLPTAKGFFSDDPNEGFVRYFDLVHACVAELARDHPDIRFYIKPKWGGPWIDRIQDAIYRESGIDSKCLPNLTISVEIPAQELIRKSSVVVGINSTTLLEAKLASRPVVIPLFAEAAGKYFQDHVYFKKYFDVFRIAHSPEEMKQEIMEQLNGSNAGSYSISDDMIRDFLGYFDGKVCARIVKKMKEDIASSRNLVIGDLRPVHGR